MDETDRELLRLLIGNARQPVAELARELGLSRATVQNRIDRLLADGTIAKFTVELGEGVDSTLVEAVVMVKLASGDSRQTVAQLKKMKEVEALTSVNGTFDFFLELRVRSLKRLDQVLVDIRRLPMVAETNSSIRLNSFK